MGLTTDEIITFLVLVCLFVVVIVLLPYPLWWSLTVLKLTSIGWGPEVWLALLIIEFLFASKSIKF